MQVSVLKKAACCTEIEPHLPIHAPVIDLESLSNAHQFPFAFAFACAEIDDSLLHCSNRNTQ
jgi:hypothetical protein